MPIKDKSLYASNWSEIRKKVIERARNKCEWCFCDNHKSHPHTGARVVLTIMHMDHDPTNNKMKNLLAACQRCHNKYDIQNRVVSRKLKLLNESQRIDKNKMRKEIIDELISILIGMDK